jgi:hypothetical protein
MDRCNIFKMVGSGWTEEEEKREVIKIIIPK